MKKKIVRQFKKELDPRQLMQRFLSQWHHHKSDVRTEVVDRQLFSFLDNLGKVPAGEARALARRFSGIFLHECMEEPSLLRRKRIFRKFRLIPSKAPKSPPPRAAAPPLSRDGKSDLLLRASAEFSNLGLFPESVALFEWFRWTHSDAQARLRGGSAADLSSSDHQQHRQQEEREQEQGHEREREKEKEKDLLNLAERQRFEPMLRAMAIEGDRVGLREAFVLLGRDEALFAPMITRFLRDRSAAAAADLVREIAFERFVRQLAEMYGELGDLDAVFRAVARIEGQETYEEAFERARVGWRRVDAAERRRLRPLYLALGEGDADFRAFYAAFGADGGGDDHGDDHDDGRDGGDDVDRDPAKKEEEEEVGKTAIAMETARVLAGILRAPAAPSPALGALSTGELRRALPVLAVFGLSDAMLRILRIFSDRDVLYSWDELTPFLRSYVREARPRRAVGVLRVAGELGWASSDAAVEIVLRGLCKEGSRELEMAVRLWTQHVRATEAGIQRAPRPWWKEERRMVEWAREDEDFEESPAAVGREAAGKGKLAPLPEAEWHPLLRKIKKNLSEF